MKIVRQLVIRFEEFEPGVGVLTLLKDGGVPVRSIPVDFSGQKHKQLGQAFGALLRIEGRGAA